MQNQLPLSKNKLQSPKQFTTDARVFFFNLNYLLPFLKQFSTYKNIFAHPFCKTNYLDYFKFIKRHSTSLCVFGSVQYQI